MSLSTLLSLASALAGLLGSAILAYSLSSFLKTLRLAWLAHETTLEALLGRGDVPRFTDMEKHFDRSEKTSNRLTVAGLMLLFLAFGLQLTSIIVDVKAGPATPQRTSQSP